MSTYTFLRDAGEEQGVRTDIEEVEANFRISDTDEDITVVLSKKQC